MPYRKILLEVRLLLHVRISHFQRQENTGGLLSQQAVGAFFRQLILNGSNVFLFRTRVLRLISLFNWEDVLSDGVCCISPPSGSSCCGGRCLCFVAWLGVGLFLVLCSFLFVSFLVVVFVGAGCFLPSRFCVSFPVALVWFLLCVWFCVLFFVFVLCWSFCFVALVFGLFWPLFGAGFVLFVWLLFLVFCFLFLFCCVFVFVFVFCLGFLGFVFVLCFCLCLFLFLGLFVFCGGPCLLFVLLLLPFPFLFFVLACLLLFFVGFFALLFWFSPVLFVLCVSFFSPSFLVSFLAFSFFRCGFRLLSFSSLPNLHLRRDFP
ncbi:unnamed protein product [Polarella glacialis]|uniref:Uncharacterized protein n=1 Tax=Polarella glacialis TaxID=89957 RepID=A0A813LSD3_POLGL|nr:unnamed protein product [Polarella glacialis]